ncbi:hypothetical protein [Flavivirga eckloniae]|uniref:Outer membrane protein beta-barrel domain-containing protein n=1 Tax=Flavivirga eckloniae TaxID=1803846 RepID=A0A2K9PL11_9FLAO|nr:hypothetical protein [Flavivirga eckloniae]AUP77754.1 hypothetical protein C1H87_03090 [Flavivirga eckloniae]
MKKLLFIAAIIINGVTFGQGSNKKMVIKKGAFNLGGRVVLVFDNYKNRDNTYKSDRNSFEVNPNFGYAIKNNLLIGLGMGYVYSKNKSYDIDDLIIDERSHSTTEGVNIFPYVKKYFSLGSKLLIHLQGEFKYSEYKQKLSNTNMLNNSNRFSNSIFVGLRPGITYFFSKNLAFETNLGAIGYTRGKNQYASINNGGNKSKSFSFNLDSSNLQFGFSYFF